MKKHFKGFVAKVEILKSERASEDKNGLLPVILIGIAGEIPSRSVISGTLANNMGLQEGSVYLFQAEEKEEDVMYGRQFNFMSISKELSAIETLQASDYVGKLKIVNVEFPENHEDVSVEHVEFEKV